MHVIGRFARDARRDFEEERFLREGGGTGGYAASEEKKRGSGSFEVCHVESSLLGGDLGLRIVGDGKTKRKGFCGRSFHSFYVHPKAMANTFGVLHEACPA